jgi:hypothetical protein
MKMRMFFQALMTLIIFACLFGVQGEFQEQYVTPTSVFGLAPSSPISAPQQYQSSPAYTGAHSLPSTPSYQYPMPTTQTAISLTALYRWSNRWNGDHFYTTNPSGESAPYTGYTFEGIIGYIATSQQPGTTALYRWSSRRNGDHFYTTDPSGERAPYMGYTFEGIIGYIATSQQPGATALYRWFNHRGYHFYITNPREIAPYIGYYAFEGITGYI